MSSGPTDARAETLKGIYCDLPAEAYAKHMVTPFPRRPGYNKIGKDTRIRVNQFRVERVSGQAVHQYDINVSPTPDKPIVYKKVWNTKTVQNHVSNTGKAWLYDGRKLAWSLAYLPDGFRKTIDLDVEQGRPSRGNNIQYLTVKHAGSIQMAQLKAYLEENTEWDDHILECMSFLDHALRQRPSETMVAIKRNFYPRQGKWTALDSAISVMKGAYSSIRLCNSIKFGGLGLAVNVDIANTTFWTSQDLVQLIRNYLGSCNRAWDNKSEFEMSDLLEPVRAGRVDGSATDYHYDMSEAFRCLRRLQKLKFTVKHHGKTQDKKVYTIRRFTWDLKYGAEGANSKNCTFTMKKTGETRSVYDHFYKQYNIKLRLWRLPCIETTRDGVFPMEVCHVPLFEKYNFKLDPNQTAAMIKFAVTRPDKRAADIQDCVKAFKWNEDPYLREFGIKISSEFASVTAKVLPPPDVQYGNGKANPQYSGRWDLRGKTFISPNTVPLKSWAFMVINNCIDQAGLKNFIRVFKDTYKKHGGKMSTEPAVLNAGQIPIPRAVEMAYVNCGKAHKDTPTMLFFVLPDKNQAAYERLKKNLECRYGVLSQMLNVQHVRKASPQYCSNVCMKVNSKLGGQTSRIPSGATGSAFFRVPTMMIGADVSHGGFGVGGSGEPIPSMAAITVSMDKDAARYAAVCQTNGYRVEIITPLNIQSMLPSIITKWCQSFQTAPANVFYFRDGVSEGQFAQVLEYEVKQIREVLEKIGKNKPKITVIVATKRHHIRFFPERGQGDRNNNPMPGTLVEKEVTHPFHYDFYLCSHVAIQGTARPVHYHVIQDEVGMPPDDLQKMIYQQCYQYARSTTPVSLHPAVYYAHLAAARAKCHENIASSKRDPKVAPKQHWLAKGTESGGVPSRLTESKPLLPIGTDQADARNVEHFKTTMWYI